MDTFTNSIEQTSCTKCDTGKTSPKGSASCSPCAAGTAGAVCTPCVQGKFRSGSDDQAAICRDCPIGFYQGDAGQGSCLPCIPGQYNDQLGLSKCKNCAENTFANSTEKQSCTDCGTGEKAVAGSAKCSKCDAGESGTGEGGTCQVCAIGQYRTSAMAAASCAPCAVGFAQNSEGQASVSFLYFFF